MNVKGNRQAKIRVQPGLRFIAGLVSLLASAACSHEVEKPPDIGATRSTVHAVTPAAQASDNGAWFWDDHKRPGRKR